MFVLDPDTTTRRWRPWHIYAGGDRYAIFALCSKVFDAKPSGLTTAGAVEGDDVICGLCLAARERQPLPHPRDMGWQALHTVEHIPIEDIEAALAALDTMPTPADYEPVGFDPDALPELVFLMEQRGYDRLADRLVS